MPDYMDQLVDAQTENELAELKKAAGSSHLDDDDRALMEEGAMTKAAAEEVTEAIKSYATATWVLVKRAHDGKAWKSLGYSTWADYVKTEFDMSASRSYQPCASGPDGARSDTVARKYSDSTSAR